MLQSSKMNGSEEQKPLKEEIEEEMKKEAERHLERLVPELEGERKQEAVEALATTLWEEWTRSMEVEMKTGEEAVIQHIKG